MFWWGIPIKHHLHLQETSQGSERNKAHFGVLDTAPWRLVILYLYLFGPTIVWRWVEKNHQLALGRVALRKPTYKAFCTKGDLYGLIMSRIIKAEGFSKWR